LRPELREKKEIEHLHDSKKNGDALARFPLFSLCKDGARQENARRQQRAGDFFGPVRAAASQSMFDNLLLICRSIAMGQGSASAFVCR
jgi:hypothetical protein